MQATAETGTLHPLEETATFGRNLRREDETPAEAVGDAERFAALVERNAGFLYSVAYSLLRSPQDAEDAVQECLLKLHRTGGWRAMESERAFLARACWRSALGRRPRKGAQFVEATDETLPAAAGTPETDAMRTSEHARLHRLIDGLPLELREPLLLSGFEELNSREMGAVLGIPEGTVRTRLKRAREELRRRWSGSLTADAKGRGRFL